MWQTAARAVLTGCASGTMHSSVRKSTHAGRSRDWRQWLLSTLPCRSGRDRLHHFSVKPRLITRLIIRSITLLNPVQHIPACQIGNHQPILVFAAASLRLSGRPYQSLR